MLDFLASMLGDDAVSYAANLTTVLVNAGLIYGAIYAFVLRRRAFFAWIQRFYTALVQLVAELREANRIARAKAEAPQDPPGATQTPRPVEASRPDPAPAAQPSKPPAAPAVAAHARSQADSVPQRDKGKGTKLPLIVAGFVALGIAFVLALYAWFTREVPTVQPEQAPTEDVGSEPPSPVAPGRTADAPWQYTVRSNDSCWSIAARASDSNRTALALCARLQAINPNIRLLAPRSEIRPGDEIVIPGDVPRALIEGEAE